jgi:glycosyltransferase involved in cell wall biosynthesis
LQKNGFYMVGLEVFNQNTSAINLYEKHGFVSVEENGNMSKMEVGLVKLTVITSTYNHEKFIRQALEGFVMQRTNFPFEVIVHDDASTDETADIIREYKEKYPHIIRPIFQTENQWNKGISATVAFASPQVKGEYVAFCEGDDYWTDPNKLQKQADFLDSHPDYSVCFHPVKVICDDNSHDSTIFPRPKFRFNKTTLTLEDLLKRNFIQTNSVMYRWRFGNENIGEIFPKGILPADYFFHLLHAEKGKIGFISDVMGVYRKHRGGMWWGAGESDDFFIRNGCAHILFWQAIQERYHKNTDAERLLLAKKISLRS